MKTTQPKLNRRWVRISIVTFFVLILLPVPLMMLLSRTSWGTEYVREQLEQTIRKELGLIAKVPTLHIDFHPTHLQPSLSVLDMELLDPIHGKFATVRSIQITPSIMDLLLGRVDVRSVDLNGATFKLKIREGQIVNLPQIQSKEEDFEGPFEIPLQEFIASNTKIEVDAEPFGKASLSGMQIAVERSFDRLSMTFQVHATGGHVEYASSAQELSDLSIKGEINPGSSLSVSRLRLKTSHLNLRLRDVWVPFSEEKSFQGRARLSLNLGDLKHLVPKDLDLPVLQGEAVVSANVQYQNDEPNITGQIKLSKAVVKDKGLGDELLLHLKYLPGKISPGTIWPDSTSLGKVLIEEGVMVVQDQGGKAKLTGELSLDDKMSLRIKGQIVELQFAKLMEQLRISQAPLTSWKFNGNFNLKGKLSPFSLVGPASFQTRDFKLTQEGWRKKKNQRIIGVKSANLKTRVRINEQFIAFEDITGKLPNSNLKAQVRLGFDDRFELDGRVSPLVLQDASPLIDFPISGKGSAEIHISGTFDNPKIEAKIQAHQFSFSDFQIGKIKSDAHIFVNQTQVVFPNLQVQKRDSEYFVDDFRIDLSKKSVQIDGQFRTPKLYVHDLLHSLDLQNEPSLKSMDGLLAGKAQVHFTKKQSSASMGNLFLDADFKLPEVNLFDHHFSSGEFVGTWDWTKPEEKLKGGQLAIDHFSLKKGLGTLVVSGGMDKGGQLGFTFAADRIELSDTEVVHSNLPKLGGFYNLLGSLDGTLDDPSVKVNASVVSTTWAGDLLGDGRLYVRRASQLDPWIGAASVWNPSAPPPTESCGYARAGLAHADWSAHKGTKRNSTHQNESAWIFCGNLFERNLTLDLALGDPPSLPVRGKISVKDFSLFPFLPKISETNLLQGSTSADLLVLEGGISNPSSFSGELFVSEIFLQNGEAFLQNAKPIKLTAKKGLFEIESFELEGKNTKLSLNGQGHFEKNIDLQIIGFLDLGLLPSFSNLVQRSRGSVEVDFQVQGPMLNPQFFGTAQVRDSDLVFSGFPDPIEQLQGTVFLRERSILFEDFRASVAGGNVSMEGQAGLSKGKLAQYQFDVTASNIQFAPANQIDLNFNGKTSLIWNQQMRIPTLKGTLRLNRFMYSRPFSISPTLTQLSQPSRAQVSQYNPQNDYLKLNLQIDSNGPLRISNNILDADLNIENKKQSFRIVGTDQQVGILGSMSVERGTFRFQDTSFDLSQGVIEFRDSTQIDPYLDISGLASVRRISDVTAPNWRINLRMFGDANNLQVNASSDPELPQEDILLLLTIGMTRSEAEQLQADAITGSAALEALATVTGIGDEVTRRISLIDDFSISSMYSSETNQTEPVISIGKKLSEKVRITASTGLSNESRNFRTGLEWKVGKRTNVQAVYDNTETQTNSSIGNIGVDLRWRLEFD